MPVPPPEAENYRAVEVYPGLLFTYAASNLRTGTWLVVARQLNTDTGNWSFCLLGEGPCLVTVIGSLGAIHPIFDPERELNLEMRQR